MRNRHASAEKIRNDAGPLFQPHGCDDDLFPIQLVRQLLANAATDQKNQRFCGKMENVLSK